MKIIEIDDKKIDIYATNNNEFLIIKIYYEIYKECGISYKYWFEALLQERKPK